jgi:hypothetical protein
MPFAPLVLILATFGEAPSARVEYYVSESRVYAPDDKPVGIIAGLVRREYRQTERKIVEMAIALDPTPGSLPTVTIIEWAVDGQTAAITERAERITGTGKLTGPAWSWTDWSWTVTMKGVPGTFRNAAKLTPRGVAIRTEQIDAAGKRLAFFDQVDTKISKETYDLLRGKLLPQ